MKMHIRKVMVYDLQDLAVVLQKHVRSEPPLQADLRGSLLLCLGGALQDLFVGEEVAIGVLERAELAAAHAFIGKIDVSVYHKRDLIAMASGPQSVSSSEKPQRLQPEPFEIILIRI
jgi:hypothetical protein